MKLLRRFSSARQLEDAGAAESGDGPPLEILVIADLARQLCAPLRAARSLRPLAEAAPDEAAVDAGGSHAARSAAPRGGFGREGLEGGQGPLNQAVMEAALRQRRPSESPSDSASAAEPLIVAEVLHASGASAVLMDGELGRPGSAAMAAGTMREGLGPSPQRNMSASPMFIPTSAPMAENYSQTAWSLRLEDIRRGQTRESGPLSGSAGVETGKQHTKPSSFMPISAPQAVQRDSSAPQSQPAELTNQTCDSLVASALPSASKTLLPATGPTGISETSLPKHLIHPSVPLPFPPCQSTADIAATTSSNADNTSLQDQKNSSQESSPASLIGDKQAASASSAPSSQLPTVPSCSQGVGLRLRRRSGRPGLRLVGSLRQPQQAVPPSPLPLGSPLSSATDNHPIDHHPNSGNYWTQSAGRQLLFNFRVLGATVKESGGGKSGEGTKLARQRMVLSCNWCAFEAAAIMREVLELWRYTESSSVSELQLKLQDPSIALFVHNDCTYLVRQAGLEMLSDVKILSDRVAALGRKCEEGALKALADSLTTALLGSLETRTERTSSSRAASVLRNLPLSNDQQRALLRYLGVQVGRIDNLRVCLNRLAQLRANLYNSPTSTPLSLSVITELALDTITAQDTSSHFLKSFTSAMPEDCGDLLVSLTMRLSDLQNSSLWCMDLGLVFLVLVSSLFAIRDRILSAFNLPSAHLTHHAKFPEGTLGAAGLSRRYIKIITIVERFISHPFLAKCNLRSELFALLPRHFKAALQHRLQAEEKRKWLEISASDPVLWEMEATSILSSSNNDNESEEKRKGKYPRKGMRKSMSLDMSFRKNNSSQIPKQRSLEGKERHLEGQQEDLTEEWAMLLLPGLANDTVTMLDSRAGRGGGMEGMQTRIFAVQTLHYARLEAVDCTLLQVLCSLTQSIVTKEGHATLHSFRGRRRQDPWRNHSRGNSDQSLIFEEFEHVMQHVGSGERAEGRDTERSKGKEGRSSFQEFRRFYNKTGEDGGPGNKSESSDIDKSRKGEETARKASWDDAETDSSKHKDDDVWGFDNDGMIAGVDSFEPSATSDLDSSNDTESKSGSSKEGGNEREGGRDGAERHLTETEKREG